MAQNWKSILEIGLSCSLLRSSLLYLLCEAEGLKKKKKQSKVAFYMKTIENRSLLFTANDK